jgi:integrase
MAVKDGITSRGNRWYVVLKELDKATGKTKAVWHSGFQTEDEAKAFRDERRVSLRKGHAVRKDKVTVEQYLAEWLPMHSQTKPLSPNTVYGYERQICIYVVPFIGKMKMQDVTTMTISRLYADLLTRQSPRTVEYTGTILRMAFRHAVSVYRIIESDPTRDVPIPRPKRKPKKTWTVEQLRLVTVHMVVHPMGALYQVLASTGCRKSEAIGLRWTDVDLDEGVVHFQQARVAVGGKVITKETLKNGLPKSVPIDPATVEALRVHRKRQAQAQLAARKWHDSGLVFTNRNGGGLHPSGYIYDEWKKICAAADVSYLTPHGLRHTHATWLLEAGVPLHVVAERLGHKDAMVTATIYAQVTGKQSRAASDVFASIMSV